MFRQVLAVFFLQSVPMLSLVAAPPELLRLPADAEAARAAQSEWARSLDVPAEVTNSLGMKLVLIPPGHFTMGPNGSTYRITLTKAFRLGETEVTLGQYRKFHPDHSVEGAAAEFNENDRPAAMVSWEEARD